MINIKKSFLNYITCTSIGRKGIEDKNTYFVFIFVKFYEKNKEIYFQVRLWDLKGANDPCKKFKCL